jgi:hypothetical protein
MAIAATFDANSPQNISRAFLITGYFTLSGNYSTGGEDLSTIIPGDAVGTRTKARELFCNDLSGYVFGYDYTNNKLKISSTAGTELGAGAYPAGLTTSNPVRFLAVCDKLN